MRRGPSTAEGVVVLRPAAYASSTEPDRETVSIGTFFDSHAPSNASPSGGIRDHSPHSLLFTSTENPESLLLELSRLRVLVDQQAVQLETAQHRERDAMTALSRLEEDLAEAQIALREERLRCALPADRSANMKSHAEVSREIRAELRAAEQARRKQEQQMEEVRHQADLTASKDFALRAELKRMSEALLSKETLLAARGRSLDKYMKQIAQMEKELADRPRSLPSPPPHTPSLADEALEEALARLHKTLEEKEQLRHELDDLRAVVNEKKHMIASLQEDNEYLHTRVKDLARDEEVAVECGATLDRFDDARREMERSFRKELAERKAVERELREELLQKESCLGAVVSRAHALQREKLVHIESHHRAATEASWACGLLGIVSRRAAAPVPPSAPLPSDDVHHDMVALMECHTATMSALRHEMQRQKDELTRLVDEAFRDGYTAAMAKLDREAQRLRQCRSRLREKRKRLHERERRIGELEVHGGDVSGVAPSTTSTSSTGSDPLQLFEAVLRRSPAADIARVFSQLGLQVIPQSRPLPALVDTPRPHE
eukprot:Sspe_Gene.76059::Locus_47520_Transcript_1_1_Confidence_1.000_Length_1902::g.76059::m.76059